MILSFDAVQLRRGSFALDVDAEFDRGVHLFRGRVGSGKSTLALAAAGVLAPVGGSVLREGCRGEPLLLMQFPEYHVTGDTVSAEITSWGVSGSEEPFDLLGVGTSVRDPLILSRGELRRLELACILSRDPDVLILDEPYASLDRAAKPILTDLLARRHGITLIFSHEQEYAPERAERWLLDLGGLHHG